MLDIQYMYMYKVRYTSSLHVHMCMLLKRFTLSCNCLCTTSLTGVAVPGGNFPQVAVPFVATNFACTGSESMLSSCSYDTAPGLLDCGHQQDAAVKCPEPCTGNSLRLAGGTSVYNGRLEVCLNGYYGTVCQGDWSVVDATVVCRQLGYSTFGELGRGRGKIMLFACMLVYY